MENWAKVFRKICPKIRSKHVWILLVTIFGFFGNLKIFGFFSKIFENSTHYGKLGQKFFEKFAPKHVQNAFGYFWELFWAILELWNFLIFFKFFEDSTFHGKLGKKFSKNLPQNLFKTRLNTFGNDFGHFWNFEIFLFFFASFRKLDPPWNTGHKIFRKICAKTRSKHVWIRLGTILAIFGILKIFWFFWKFLLLGTIFSSFGILKKHFLKIFEYSTLHGALGIKIFQKNQPKTLLGIFGNDLGQIRNIEFFSIFFHDLEVSSLHGTLVKNFFFEKITSKQVQNTFEHFWERFRANSEYLDFFGFFQDLEVSSLHGTLGKNFFWKNLPRSMFKTRLDTFGIDFRLFWNFENFWFFFENFRKLDPPWKTGQKSFEKFAPKHVQNTFGLFWERFWAYLDFWDFFDSSQKLQDSTLHGKLGKSFSKNLPQNTFKTRLDTFGNDFGLFWNFENFWFFSKIFENSTLH